MKEEGPAGSATDHTSAATALAVVSTVVAADPNAVVGGSTIAVVVVVVVKEEEEEEGLKAWCRQGLGRDRHICSSVPCTFFFNLLIELLFIWFFKDFFCSRYF